MVIHTYNPSYLEGRGRRTAVQGQPGQKHKTMCEKQTKSKRIGVRQVTEHWSNKRKALSSNPSTAKIKKTPEKIAQVSKQHSMTCPSVSWTSQSQCFPRGPETLRLHWERQAASQLQPFPEQITPNLILKILTVEGKINS
jgi:hypothetical protein